MIKGHNVLATKESVSFPYKILIKGKKKEETRRSWSINGNYDYIELIIMSLSGRLRCFLTLTSFSTCVTLNLLVSSVLYAKPTLQR